MGNKYNVKPKVKLVADDGKLWKSRDLASFIVDFIAVKALKIHFKKKALSQADECRAKNKALTHIRRHSPIVGIRPKRNSGGFYHNMGISFELLVKHIRNSLEAKSSDEYYKLLREPTGS